MSQTDIDVLKRNIKRQRTLKNKPSPQNALSNLAGFENGLHSLDLQGSRAYREDFQFGPVTKKEEFLANYAAGPAIGLLALALCFGLVAGVFYLIKEVL